MKRMHIHITVEDLHKSILFYSAMFGAEPTVKKHDYAKWAIEDPKRPRLFRTSSIPIRNIANDTTALIFELHFENYLINTIIG